MILVHFQGKTFSITIIQVFKPATVLKKLKLNGAMKTYETKKRYHFHHRGLECEVKGALGSITTSKLVKGMEFQLSYFKS